MKAQSAEGGKMRATKLLAVICLLVLCCPGLSRAEMADLENLKISKIQIGNQELSVGIGGRFGLEFHQYSFDLNDEIETTPAHPADSPTGHTTTDLNDNPNGLLTLLVIGPLLIVQGERIYFSSGADFRLGGSQGGYRKGIYDTKLADYGGESYAFTQIIPEGISINPHLCLGYHFIDPLIIYGEFGLPINSFKIKTGHDRWGKWETVRKDTWEGTGQKYSLGLIILPQDNYSLDFQVFNERYQVKFFEENAKITSWGVNLYLNYWFNLTK